MNACVTAGYTCFPACNFSIPSVPKVGEQGNNIPAYPTADIYILLIQMSTATSSPFPTLIDSCEHLASSSPCFILLPNLQLYHVNVNSIEFKVQHSSSDLRPSTNRDPMRSFPPCNFSIPSVPKVGEHAGQQHSCLPNSRYIHLVDTDVTSSPFPALIDRCELLASPGHMRMTYQRQTP